MNIYVKKLVILTHKNKIKIHSEQSFSDFEIQLARKIRTDVLSLYREISSLGAPDLCPKPLVIAERFRFFKRQQAVGESVSEYCAVLQILSETCDFGANLEDSLRDRVVCGIRSDQSQKRFLTEKNLTFKKAKEMALAMEMAIKDTKEQQGATGGAENVNKMRKSGDNKPCYRCGKSNHVSDDCNFKNTKCNNCGKIGHIYRKCKQEKVRRKKPKR